jgi:hypothetical protein
MKEIDPMRKDGLERLLHSAARAVDDKPAEAPFGFETRVVALWRAGAPNGNNGVARLLRRVAILATAVIALSSAAVLYQTSQESANDEQFMNAFAIADSAIETEVP